MSFFSGIVQSVEDIFQGPRDVVTAAEGTVHVYESIWAAVSDWRMWASIGWLLLGLILIGIGLLLLLRKPIENVAGQVAKAVVLLCQPPLSP